MSALDFTIIFDNFFILYSIFLKSVVSVSVIFVIYAVIHLLTTLILPTDFEIG